MERDAQQSTVAWLLKIFGSTIAALLAAGVIAVVAGDRAQDRALASMQDDVSWIRAQMATYETHAAAVGQREAQKQADASQNQRIDSVAARVSTLESYHRAH